MILQKTNDLNYIPKRIISLVPSQTELLHYFNLEEETIGITKFCVHPKAWHQTKTRVGGTKAININKIKELQPDLIIANKEENVQEQIEELALDYPVWVTDVNNLDDALKMITDIGELTNKEKEANLLVKEINIRFENLSHKPQTTNYKPKTAYLIWQKPYMTVGGDTFINDMLLKCGFQNIFADKSRYPEVTIEDLQIANCQLLLLSSEPYPFKQKHIDELQVQLPDIKIILADGEFFSWYGSRLLQAPSYFKQLISQMQPR
jgi:ABC-type Fe3+-hydroxamate transport system substrate-binding protein